MRATCGQFVGWDFSRWDVVTAASSRSFLTAWLRSTNGYMARCQLAVADLRVGVSSVAFAAADWWRDDAGRGDYRLWLPCLRDETTGTEVHRCFDLGWLPGPEPAERVVVSWPGGAFGIDVVDGWYAAAADLAVDWPYDSPGPLEFTVHAADGTELARYTMADLPHKAWDES